MNTMHVYRSMTLALILVAFFISVDASGLFLAHQPVAAQNTDPIKTEPVGPRKVVVISDLHFGVGKTPTGEWDPTEDFRWSKALVAFLQEISTWGNNRVDLVIAGDLLELWQPPASLTCASEDPDYGCTVPEIERLAQFVVEAHQKDLAALGKFAETDQNRLIIIPGNHDAALLLPTVWQKVTTALKIQTPEKVHLVETGEWTSQDGKIVVEHGHQIGQEVNKWASWPNITKMLQNKSYLIRPWGERFVQKRFNEREAEYEIIDNLSPETAGIRYYMADQSILGNLKDMASFLKFNIVETSLMQKVAFLGDEGKESKQGAAAWDLDWARKTWGYRLIADALPLNDPLRQNLRDEKQQTWEGLRTALTALTKDSKQLSDEELRHLCARLTIRTEQAKAEFKKEKSPLKNGQQDIATCVPPAQSYLLEGLLVPRDWILKSHLEDHRLNHPKMKAFVYGHTHALEFDWKLEVFGKPVSIVNTGAFQRLIDDEKFLALAQAAGKTASEALRTFKLEKDLPACYAAVLIDYQQQRPDPQVKHWYMEENQDHGELVGPCDSRCAQVSKQCQK